MKTTGRHNWGGDVFSVSLPLTAQFVDISARRWHIFEGPQYMIVHLLSGGNDCLTTAVFQHLLTNQKQKILRVVERRETMFYIPGHGFCPCAQIRLLGLRSSSSWTWARAEGKREKHETNALLYAVHWPKNFKDQFSSIQWKNNARHREER